MFRKTLSAVKALHFSFLILFFTYTLVQLYQAYVQTCPNRDVLSWDGNLRFIQALDLWGDIGNFRFSSIASFILSAPTWPPFRQMIVTLLFYLSGGPSTDLEIYLTLFTFAALFLSLIYILHSLLDEAAISVMLASTVVSSLLVTDQLPKFILSAMLEIQGMLFFTWAIFSIFSLYRIIHRGGRPEKNAGILIFVSTFGLYFTKYPYGIIFLLGVIAYELIMNMSIYLDLVNTFMKNRELNILKIGALLTILISALSLAAIIKTGSIKLLSAYLVFISWIFLILSGILYYRYRNYLREALPVSLRTLLTWFICPVLIWTIANPDRIGGILDTQAHVQNEDTLFFLSYFNAVYGYSAIPVFTVLLTLYGIFRLFILNKNHSVRQFIAEPSVAVLLIIVIQMVILELTTSNKQLRHVYHLLPALMLCPILILNAARGKSLFTYELSLSYPLLLAASSVLIYLMIFIKPISGMDVCFTGTSGATVDPARWAASKLSRPSRYLLINRFHDMPDSTDYHHLSSDFDLLLRMSPHATVRNDSRYRYRDWDDFDELIVLNESCLLEEKVLNRIRQAAGVIPKLTEEYRHPKGGLCMMFFRLQNI